MKSNFWIPRNFNIFNLKNFLRIAHSKNGYFGENFESHKIEWVCWKPGIHSSYDFLWFSLKKDHLVLKKKTLKFLEIQPTYCWLSNDKWELNFNETYLQVFRACRDQSFYYLIFFVWSKVLSNQYFCKEITRLRTVHHFQMIFMVFFRLATDLYIIYVWKHSNT